MMVYLKPVTYSTRLRHADVSRVRNWEYKHNSPVKMTGLYVADRRRGTELTTQGAVFLLSAGVSVYP
jgi:hypothetical protein